jgi:hypothetical protein
MNRLDYYFRELLTEGELDLGFDYVQDIIESQVHKDAMALQGMVTGGVVAPKAPASLFVEVSGSGHGYTPEGKQLTWTAAEDLNCSTDELSIPTAVITPGNTKWLTVFVRFKEDLQDPRIDGNGFTVYFKRLADHEFYIAQGAEGLTPIRPPLRDDSLVLADILISFGQTQIQAGDLYVNRREDYIRAEQTPRSLVYGQIRPALTSLLTYYNDHVRNGSADRHNALDLDFDGYSFVGAGNMDAAWKEMLNDLAATTDPPGASYIGIDAYSQTPSGGTALSICGCALRTAFRGLVNQLTDFTVTPGADRIGAQQKTGSNIGVMPNPPTLLDYTVDRQIQRMLNYIKTIQDTPFAAINCTYAGHTSAASYAAPVFTNAQVNVEAALDWLLDEISKRVAKGGDRMNGYLTFGNTYGLKFRDSGDTADTAIIDVNAAEELNFKIPDGLEAHFFYPTAYPAGVPSFSFLPSITGSTILRVRSITANQDAELQLYNLGGTRYWGLGFDDSATGLFTLRDQGNNFLQIQNTAVADPANRFYWDADITDAAPSGEYCGYRHVFTCGSTGAGGSYHQTLRINSSYNGVGTLTAPIVGLLNILDIGASTTIAGVGSVYWGRANIGGVLQEYRCFHATSLTGGGGVSGAAYQLYLETMNAGATNNRYGIYQLGTLANGVKNYLAGWTIIGAADMAGLTTAASGEKFRISYSTSAYLRAILDAGQYMWTAAGGSLIMGTEDSNYTMLYTNGVNRLRINSDGKIMTGNTSSPPSALDVGGIYLHQGAGDNDLLVFASSDCNITAGAPPDADSYGAISKNNPTGGGLTVFGWADATDPTAIGIGGYSATENTATTTAAVGTLTFFTNNSLTATGNLAVWRAAGATQMLLKGNGTLYVNTNGPFGGYVGVYDDQQDALACRDAAYGVAGQWKRTLQYGRKELERLGVMSGGFMNVQAMNALTLSGVSEVYQVLDWVLKNMLSSDYESARSAMRAEAARAGAR